MARAVGRSTDLGAIDQSPRFTVIVPTFNRLDLLKETISSIKKQTYNNFEVIVVDDGSTDGTPAWLVENEPHVRLIQQTHRGPGAARNLGARSAMGSYLAFLDSDDLWLPWTLQTYHQLILERKNPAFVVGRQYVFSNPNRDSVDLLADEKVDSLFFLDYLASCDEWRWWGASSFVIRKDVFQKSHGFSELNVYAEDADLALRLGIETGFVQVLSPPTFAYRRHATNSMANLARTIDGAWLLIGAERGSVYPGGRRRSKERLEIITRHIRPTVFASLNGGDRNTAVKLYNATFWWNLRLLRIRYLFAFPLFLASSFVWPKAS